MQRRWASDWGRSAAYKSAAFQDLDGSVSGIPGAYIVIDNGIASNEGACEIRQSWNAAVCVGDMGRLSIAGNFSGFQTGPITDPIILQRNGRRFEYTGGNTIGSGAEVRVETARDTLTLSLQEMDQGSFVIFELPEFTTAAQGVEQSSLAALRDTSETSYYKDGDALWVKLVVADARGAALTTGGPGGPGAGGPASGTRIEVRR
jgi:cell migration-inducing and hyaluronan-binding protein